MQLTHIQSDIVVNPDIFSDRATTDVTREFNEKLINLGASGPRWFEVGAAKYRAMREAGETPLPKATLLEKGQNIELPSRDTGRSIPCRLMLPDDMSRGIKGVFCHFHGGGWVLSDEKAQDLYLNMLANSNSLAVVSVGYRLAPENQFPAGPNDGVDCVAWLNDNAKDRFGALLKFVSGESAGAHIASIAILDLLSKRPTSHTLAGIILNAGVYDLTLLPNVRNFDSQMSKRVLILNHEILGHYLNAFVPGKSGEELKEPHVSPYYFDLTQVDKSRAVIPPAMFTIGTMDPLLDDSLNMFIKWQRLVQLRGAEPDKSVIKIFPGEAHGFTIFDGREGGYAGATASWQLIAQYISERLGS